MRLEMTAGEKPSARPASDMLPVATTLAKISRSPRFVVIRNYFLFWNKCLSFAPILGRR
jgi:hypothetical protein